MSTSFSDFMERTEKEISVGFSLPNNAEPTSSWRDHGDAWLQFAGYLAIAVAATCLGYILALWTFLPLIEMARTPAILTPSGIENCLPGQK